ncbi:MAG: sulfotransferase [Rudaea sp.]
MRSGDDLPPFPVIVGAPRSGTTMLRLMLDAHPDLAVPPETGFLALLPGLHGEGDALRESALQVITRYPSEAPGWADFGIAEADLALCFAAIHPFTVASAARAFYRLYASRFGKSRGGDKTPSYCFHIAAISRLMPEARFIHLVRDGRDVALSLRDLWFAPGREMETLAAHWVAHVAAAESSAVEAPRLRVHYEELVLQPELVLRRICEFIELPFHEDMLRSHERATQRLGEPADRVWLDGSFRVSREQRLHQQRNACLPPAHARVHAWRREMRPDDILRFAAIAGPLLHRLGYMTDTNERTESVVRAEPPLRILLAIGFLSYRSGAELFVRDLALGLQRRGHSVIVYAPLIGDLGDDLRSACVSCVTDLSMVASAPELLIGNTCRETVLALGHFAGVPAISVCHDRVHPHGMPPKFARVRRHVAVDANTYERLVLENGIAADRVKTIFNGVDTARFARRSLLPARPQRAVIFGNMATAGAETEAVRRACAKRGITLDVVGKESGNQAREPAMVLPQYDLVFAKARCALEAMAVGCAVVVLNQGMGMGEMVHSSRVPFMRQWNFGRRLLIDAIDEASVGAQIDRYDAIDAAIVCDMIRNAATLDGMVDAFCALAGEVVAEAAAHPMSAQAEWREFAAYTDHVHHWLDAAHAQLHDALGDAAAARRQAGEVEQRARQSSSEEAVANRALRDEIVTLATQQRDAGARLESAAVLARATADRVEQEQARHASAEAALREELATLTRQAAERSQREQDKHAAIVAELREALTALTVRQSDTLGKLGAARGQVSELRDALIAVRASYSWRLTGPLRWIASFLRPRR